MDWAAIVGWVRARQGLKQAAFAHLLDVDQATVSRWECGKQSPGLSIRKTLTQMLSQMDPPQDLAVLNARLADHRVAIANSMAETLLATIEGAKAKAEQLTAHLASETARAGDLTARIAAAERIVAETIAEEEAPADEEARTAKSSRCELPKSKTA